MLTVQKPRLIHAREIEELIKNNSRSSRILKRDYDEICSGIRSFFTVFENNQVAGCISLAVFSPELGEIRSLIVDQASRGKQLGKMLLAACENEARELGIQRLFALTLIPEFFLKNGFKTVSRDIFPHKIWQDCLKCERFPDCDETACLKVLGEF